MYSHDLDFLATVLTILAVILVIQLRGLKRKLDGFLSMEDRLRDLQRDMRRLLHPAEPATREKPAEAQGKAQTPPLPETPAIAPAKVVLPALPKPPAPPPSLPVPPRQPSKFAQSVGDILNRIWQWILVGEEFRPTGVTLEYAVATTWLARVGIVVLVVGVGYFLKWSIDRNLLGPSARVAMSIIFGLGMLGGGFRLLGRKLDILGQGFVGGGLAILYFSMYALGPLYHLVDSTVLVFALMILVTVTAGVLALYANSILVAIFGIIGGFCTPILLSTGQVNYPGLFGYLLLLNLGILAISMARSWRLLNMLSFVFTYGLYIASLKPYQTSDFPVVITFLALFFIIHSTLVFTYNLRRGIPATVLEIIHLVLNASLFALAAYWLIMDAKGRPYPALMTLALAAYYVLHVVFFLQRKLGDRPLLIALIALAGFFTTMTLPLALEKETLTIAWALQAYLFLRLGVVMQSNFLRQLGYALYGLTFIRIAGFELPRFSEIPLPASATLSEYWRAMSGRVWTFGITIASVFGASRLELKAAALKTGQPAEPTPDVRFSVPEAVSQPVFFWAVIVCVFLYLNFELHAMFRYFLPWRPSVMTAIWIGMAAFFLFRCRANPTPANLGGLLFFAGGAILKNLILDLPEWDLCERCYYNHEYTPMLVCMRWTAFLSILAVLAGSLVVSSRTPVSRSVPAVFGYTGLALLWLYTSLELNSLLHWKLKIFQEGGISLLWTLFAFAFVSGGIWKNLKALRYSGLALFAVVIGKVFLVDLAKTPGIYRIAALMILGALLLLGAFAYLKSNKRFQKGTP